MIDEDAKDENKIKTSRENKRVNIVNQDVEQITCAYCKRFGHEAVNCITLARYYGQQRANQNNFNGQSGFNSNNFNGQSGFNSNNFNGQSGFDLNNSKGQNRSGQNNGQNNGQNISSRIFFGNGNNSRNFANNRYINFGGWNAENRRAPFLPNENNQNNERNFNNYQNGQVNRNGNNNYSNNTNFPRNRQEQYNSRFPSCFYCGRLGHVQRNCYKFQNDTGISAPPAQ